MAAVGTPHLKIERYSVIHRRRWLQTSIVLQHPNFNLKWHARTLRNSSSGSSHKNVFWGKEQRACVTAKCIHVDD